VLAARLEPLRLRALIHPYYAYEIDLRDLARHGTLEMSPSRLSFASSGDWEVAQIPLFGIGRRREGWSLARDAQGRLVFSQSLHTMYAMFWVIPVPSRTEVRCVLAPALDAETISSRSK
jgi:hypothetical protein